MRHSAHSALRPGEHPFHVKGLHFAHRSANPKAPEPPSPELSAFVDSEDAQHGFLNDALAIGHTGTIAAALGLVARVRGMSGLAAETGISRQQLYRALRDDGNPTLETLTRVVTGLGYRLAVERDRPKATVASRHERPEIPAEAKR